MDLIISKLRIHVEKDGIDEYIKAASEKLGLSNDSIRLTKILSKSLNISNKEAFYYELSIVVSLPESFDNKANLPLYTEKITPHKNPITTKERPIIIGFGPAGIFAALELIEHGI